MDYLGLPGTEDLTKTLKDFLVLDFTASHPPPMSGTVSVEQPESIQVALDWK